MAILEVLRFPDSRLRNRAEPVELFDESLAQLVDDMFDTMYEAPGIGLAAIQVNVAKRVVVIDITEDRSNPLCLINPEILGQEGEEESEEGCLSVPGFYDLVKRAAKVKVKALDREGSPFELEADGLLAICIQHEIDHLEGRLFVDYISALKRSRIRKKLEKEARQEDVPEPSSHRII